MNPNLDSANRVPLKLVVQFSWFSKLHAEKFSLILTLLNKDLSDKWSQDCTDTSHTATCAKSYWSHRCRQHLQTHQHVSNTRH